MWHGGRRGEEELLAGCYRRALEVAVANGVHTIAFPAISTGVYRFPPARAAEIAVATVAAFLADDATLEKVVFCCFGRESRRAHETALAAL